MDTAASRIATAKETLAGVSARLTQLDNTPVPEETRLRWLHMCQRKTLLRDLVSDTETLATAHANAGDPLSALAITELTEHYRHQYALAARAVEMLKPAIARRVRQAAHHPSSLQDGQAVDER